MWLQRAFLRFNDKLEELVDVLSPEDYGAIVADTQRRYSLQYGPNPTFAPATAIPAGTKPLALPPEAKAEGFVNIGKLDASTLLAPSMIQGLQLPPLDMKQLGVQFEATSALFFRGVEQFVKALKLSSTAGVTVNLSAPITVQATGDRAIAQKTGESVPTVLGRVVGQAGAIAKSRR